MNFATRLTACLLLVAASPAFAYVGPGAGLSAIGTFLAVIGGVLLMVLGFLWYPIKRMLRRNKPETVEQDPEDDLDQPPREP